MLAPSSAKFVPPKHQSHLFSSPHRNVNICQLTFQGFKGAAIDIYQGAVEGHELKGIPGAVGGVLKHVPGSAILPFVITTGGTSTVLEGLKNQMAPDKRREMLEKWKPEEEDE